jgi:hypothetical protein
MPAGRPIEEMKVGRRLTDPEIVGISLDVLEQNGLLDDKKSLKYMLEVISERRPRPRELV